MLDTATQHEISMLVNDLQADTSFDEQDLKLLELKAIGRDLYKQVADKRQQVAQILHELSGAETLLQSKRQIVRLLQHQASVASSRVSLQQTETAQQLQKLEMLPSISQYRQLLSQEDDEMTEVGDEIMQMLRLEIQSRQQAQQQLADKLLEELQVKDAIQVARANLDTVRDAVRKLHQVAKNIER